MNNHNGKGAWVVLVAATLLFTSAGATAADDELDEVVVTGIRGSFRQAMEIKRNSEQIVDSIASESLGKIP